MYVFLGWLNVFLFVVMTAPFWLRFLNTHLLHMEKGTYFKVIKVLRAVHKPLGGVILAIALVHGYLALGGFRLHTGTLLWIATAVTAALGLSFYLFKKKALFVWHKRMALIVVCLVLVHLVFPSAVYYLLY